MSNIRLTYLQVVHAQQLGWEWFPPAEATLALSSSSDPHAATGDQEAGGDQDATTGDDHTHAGPGSTASGMGLAATSSDDAATRAMLDLLVK